MREYAVYKGENIIAMGTAKECAEKLGVKTETIMFYTYPTYQRRLAKRKTTDNCIIVVALDEK